MNLNFKDNILPHLIAVMIFLLLTVIFFSPLIFNDKNLAQNDILQGAGAGQEIVEYREQTGKEALWTNSMFGGMPAYLINTKWSGDLMAYVAAVYRLGLPSPADILFVAMLSFYILLLAFKVRPYLAIAGAIAFGLGSFNIISIEAGHIWKVRAIAYMPLVLAGVHLVFRKKYLPGLVLTALAVALEIRANHLQITYYLFLLLLIYGIVMLIFQFREDGLQSVLKISGTLLVAGILAITCNFGRLWTVYEYGQFSIRGPSELTSGESPTSAGLDKDYAFRWSNGIMEPITFIIPNFYGGASQQSLDSDSNLGEVLSRNGLAPVQVREQLRNVTTYWGQQPGVAGPVYAGSIMVLFFVLGLLLAPKKHVYWIAIAVGLSIALSWGSNFQMFNYFMFDYFPGYDKFRSVTMTVVIALLCIPLLAMLALEKVMVEGWTERNRKKFYLAGGIVLGFLLLIALLAGIFSFRGSVDEVLSQGGAPDWYIDALRSDRKDLLRSDAIRSLLFAGAVFAVVFYYLKTKLSETLALVLIILLTCLDHWFVNKRYISTDDFITRPIQTFEDPNEADQFILSDPQLNIRVLNLQGPWNEARTSFHHQSLGGYHGAKMRRYQDLIERCLTPEIETLISQLRANQSDFSAVPVINMLNTKYLLAGDRRESVITNRNPWGNAWFVSKVEEVSSPDQEIQATCNLTDPQTAVVNSSRWNLNYTDLSGDGSIELMEATPNFLKYSSSNRGAGLAVFSEIFYPKGWKASIDGESAEILQVNYILRGLEIPAGEHTIEFTFEPAAYYTGNTIMLIGSLLLLLLGLYTLFHQLKFAVRNE